MATMNRLSAKKAQAAAAGKIADGMGLWLFKREDGRGQWVLRVSVYGRRREMGLGTWPEVSLAEARSTAEGARAEVRKGRDPILERQRKRQEASPATTVADYCAADDTPSCRANKHAFSVVVGSDVAADGTIRVPRGVSQKRKDQYQT